MAQTVRKNKLILEVLMSSKCFYRQTFSIVPVLVELHQTISIGDEYDKAIGRLPGKILTEKLSFGAPRLVFTDINRMFWKMARDSARIFVK